MNHAGYLILLPAREDPEPWEEEEDEPAPVPPLAEPPELAEPAELEPEPEPQFPPEDPPLEAEERLDSETTLRTLSPGAMIPLILLL